MLKSAFELAEDLNKKKIAYSLHQPLWSKYDLSALDLNIANWHTIKYLNENASDFSAEISDVPNDLGGLYLFSIKCDVISGITDYPVYIGRAQLTKGQNLRKRCREYFRKYAREDERPLITKMINYWGHNLYLSFMTFDENDDIIDYEKKLINSLLLPFNNQIPDTEISAAIKAF